MMERRTNGQSGCRVRGGGEGVGSRQRMQDEKPRVRKVEEKRVSFHKGKKTGCGMEMKRTAAAAQSKG